MKREHTSLEFQTQSHLYELRGENTLEENSSDCRKVPSHRPFSRMLCSLIFPADSFSDVQGWVFPGGVVRERLFPWHRGRELRSRHGLFREVDAPWSWGCGWHCVLPVQDFNMSACGSPGENVVCAYEPEDLLLWIKLRGRRQALRSWSETRVLSWNACTRQSSSPELNISWVCAGSLSPSPHAAGLPRARE